MTPVTFTALFVVLFADLSLQASPTPQAGKPRTALHWLINAGLQVVLSQGFLDEVNVIFPSLLEKAVGILSIPPINGTFNIDVLGEFGYWYSNVHFEL